MANLAEDVTLVYSGLQLAYSVTKYCAPLWARSTHCSKVDVQLKQTMRIISGTIKSTPNEWLPVLPNIAPPNLRKQSHTTNTPEKLSSLPNLPLQIDIL